MLRTRCFENLLARDKRFEEVRKKRIVPDDMINNINLVEQYKAVQDIKCAVVNDAREYDVLEVL